MNKEFFYAYTRLCTVQMNVFKQRVPKCNSFELTSQTNQDGTTSLYINVHLKTDPGAEPALKHWWITNNDSADTLNGILNELSEYIDFPV